MDKVQEVNEKIGILTVIVGFGLGIYLGIGHDDPNLWFKIVQWIFMIAILMTLFSTVLGYYAKMSDDDAEFNLSSTVRVFVLNVAMIAVSTSFGFVFASILIGNFNTAN